VRVKAISRTASPGKNEETAHARVILIVCERKIKRETKRKRKRKINSNRKRK
jgi:hypothetical protein